MRRFLLVTLLLLAGLGAVDYEYERRGTANLFLTREPLVGQRHLAATEQRTAVNFAQEARDRLEVRHPRTEKVVLVMDNSNPYKPAVPCEAFEPARARSLLERLRFLTPPSMAVGRTWPRSNSAC